MGNTGLGHKIMRLTPEDAFIGVAHWLAWLAIWLFFSAPWLVVAWFAYSNFLAGAPEPQFWLDLEKAMGAIIR